MVLPLWLTKLLIRTRVAGLLPVAHRFADGGTGFLRFYSDRILAAPIGELLDSAYFPGPAGVEVIDLNQPAPRFDAALGPARLAADRRGHPHAWGDPELRNAIANLHVRRDGRAVDPDREVFVTNGASAAFAAALDAFVNPGDRVALFDPCSPLFHLGARSRRAKLRWVPTWTEDGRLRFPPAAFEKAVRGAKLLVLCDPANPTGACLSPEDLEYVTWFAAASGTLIYSDESFARFRYDGRGRSVAVMSGADQRVITAGSVAQGWGLGAARVGWLAGHRHLIQACALSANLSAPFVPPVCQHLAARAIGEPDEAFDPVRDQFRSRRRYTIDRLKGMGLEPEWPGGGYFAWVPVLGSTGLDGRTFAARLLKEQRVLVGPGCGFGPGGGGHVRVSFAAEDGRLREGLSRLAAFLNGLKNPPAATEVPTEEPPAEATVENAEGEHSPVFTRS